MKINPCPFCGSTDNYCYTMEYGDCKIETEYIVECHNCNADGPNCDTKEEAIEKWNTRHNYYPAPHDVEEYYKDDI